MNKDIFPSTLNLLAELEMFSLQNAFLHVRGWWQQGREHEGFQQTLSSAVCRHLILREWHVGVFVLTEHSKNLPGSCCMSASILVLSPVKQFFFKKGMKKDLLQKGTHLQCCLQFCKVLTAKSGILLNQRCKQKQITELKTLDLQGKEKEELKGFPTFLLFC